MIRGLVMVMALGSAVVGFPLAAASGQGDYGGRGQTIALAPAADVGAYGNVFMPQNLAFRPAKVTIAVGQTVRWTNHDSLVPHTASEDHGLWDLAGSYGRTPANPSGFAPGTSVQRVFEAGTQHYYCRVHPKQMHGVIAVPVDLSVTRTVKRRHHKHVVVYTATARWAAASPASGLVFDVQRAQGSRPYADWLTATSASSATFTTTHRGSVWRVRARLRKASDATAATDFSPDASVTAR
jgi:plastocyanin